MPESREWIAVGHCAALPTCSLPGSGGYNFTHSLDDAAWLEQRAKMARVMEFSSTPLGESHMSAAGAAALARLASSNACCPL